MQQDTPTEREAAVEMVLRQQHEGETFQGTAPIQLKEHANPFLPFNAANLGPFQVNQEHNVCKKLPKDSADSELTAAVCKPENECRWLCATSPPVGSYFEDVNKSQISIELP